MKRVLHVNYDWASNLFVLVEFFFLSFYYRDKIFRNKTVFYTVLATLSTFFVVQTLRADKSIWHFNTYGSCVFCLTYIIYCILGMYALLKEQKVIFLDRSPLFWVNVGFILYSSGSFLLFLFKIYLQETDMDLLRTLWTAFFLPCNILKNIALAIGLRKKNAL